jgi:hypothetical protein
MTTNQQDSQLELGLGNRIQRSSVRKTRAQRARWWFNRMRQVVDNAFDWESAPARAEQMWMPGSYRLPAGIGVDARGKNAAVGAC